MQAASLRDDERGVAAVIVILALPVLVVFVAFVVNVGRWWVVDRHMQTQADAAALAAGTELSNDPLHCSASRVVSRARQYAGISATVPGESAAASYNEPGSVNTPAAGYDPNFRFNSADYALGGTSDADAASFTGTNADPCVSGIADVKLTSAAVPGLLQAIGVAPDIDAHARVALLKAGQPGGISPFGVETADPKRVYAEVVDLADGSSVPLYTAAGTPVSGFDLTKGGSADGLTTWASNVSYTLRSSTSGRLGVRLRLSDSAGTVDCTSSAVSCLGYGSAGTQANSLTAIRVFTDPDAAGAAGVRAGVVSIQPGACDAASADTGYFQTTCTSVTVVAHVKGLDRQTNPVVKIAGVTAADTSTSGDPNWTATVPLTLGSGANDLAIDWSQKAGAISKPGGGQTACTSKTPCTGTIANAHRTFSGALANANVVKHLDVAIGTGGGATSNNLMAGTCSATTPCPVAISTALGGSVTLAKPSDPAIALRLGDSGSLTGLLDCNPDTSSTSQEIALGCGVGRYVENSGQDCTKYANVSQLFGDTTAMPWPCAGTEQGNRVSQIPIGMNARILCVPFTADPSSCLTQKTFTCTAKNHWPNFTTDDPRIIPMFLVPVGGLAQSGATVYPVIAFAAFYVTGWTGSPCTGADNEIPAAYSGDKASVFGHWVKYIPPALDSPTNQPCDVAALSICTPVLVK